MSKSITTRFLTLLGLWLVAIWLPWWLLLALALWAIWYWSNFYELLLVGLWYDSVYGPGGSIAAPAWPLLATLITVVLICVAELAKESVVLYRRPF